MDTYRVVVADWAITPTPVLALEHVRDAGLCLVTSTGRPEGFDMDDITTNVALHQAEHYRKEGATMPIAPEDRIYDEDLPGFWDRTPAEHYIEAERLLADADREAAASANAQMRVAKAQVHAILSTYIHEPVELREEPMRFDPPSLRRSIVDTALPAEPDELTARRSLHGQPDGV